MKQNKNKRYEAQALAITMVILIVSSIIAMSIYFRSQKDKTLTLEERASTEALEISSLIIDKLTFFPIQNVIAKISELQDDKPFDYVNGTVPPLKENKDNTEITDLFSALGIQDSVRDLSICPASQGLNEYQLTIKQADENTYFEIRPGQIWSLPIKGFNLDSSCQMFLAFSVRGNTDAGFVLSKAYAKNYIEDSQFAQSYKKYSYEDIESHCFSDSGNTCNAQDEYFYDNSWIPYNITEQNKEILVNLNEQNNGYVLDEVRIKAVGGTIGIKYRTSPAECLEGLRLLHLRVSANCSGVYRGIEVLIPEKKWHNSLFDYVIFNGQGSI